MNGKNRRKNRRVADALAMRIENASNTTIAPLGPDLTHVVNLSLGGLRFTHERRLSTNKKLRLTMRLGKENKMVSLNGTVVSSGEATQQANGRTHSRRFFACVEFNNLGAEVLQLLNQQIETVIEQTQANCRVYTYSVSSSQPDLLKAN